MKKFTDMYIRNLKPETKKVYIRESEGFTIRIMPSGIKTWLYVYTFDGKRKELNLGLYPDVKLATAKERHSDAKKLLNNGKDPSAVALEEKIKKTNAFTVAEVIKEYLERHAKIHKKSWEEDERILNKEVLPLWGKRKISDITKRDIKHVVDGIVNRNAPVMANNTFKIIRRMFNYASDEEIIQYSPTLKIKLPTPVVLRERTLSQNEIKLFWNNIDSASMSDDTRRALKLILVTAQRSGEVAGIHTDEINDRWWTIPSVRSKNGKAHRVYLTDTALELIGELTITDKNGEVKPKGFIFPCPHKKKIRSLNRHALSRAISKNISFQLKDQKGNLRFDADGNPVTVNKLGVEHFTPHDLRRTASTFFSELGAMDEVIDAVLNHTKQGIIKTYNLYKYEKEKQHALEVWDQKLKDIILDAGVSIPVVQKDNVIDETLPISYDI